MKYRLMVINDIFEKENLLILKNKDNEIIKRYENDIEKETVENFLDNVNVSFDDCEIYIVKTDWKDNARIEKV